MPYDVTVTRLETQALFDLQGPAAALQHWAGNSLPVFPERPNTKRATPQGTLMLLGPDHWILRAELSRESALEAALRPAEAPPEISVARISDTLVFFRIAGPDAREILSIACPLDLHPRHFCADAASFTAAFGIRALITQCDGGFDVAVDQSYGPMMALCLARAGA